MAGKKGMKHYPLELKLEAMRMFYEDGKTRKQITETLNIRDPERVQFNQANDFYFISRKF